jgi:hypothetical protein
LTTTAVPGWYDPKVNGPVPSAPVTPYLSPSFATSSMLQTIEFSVASVSGKAVNGVCIVATTVVGSAAVTFLTAGQKIAFWPLFGLRKTLKLSATTDASQGAPLWNVRSGRSLNVHVRRSGEISHDSNIDAL